jgi:hypothetical protein
MGAVEAEPARSLDRCGRCDPSGTATHCDPTVGSTVSKYMLPRQSRRVESSSRSAAPNQVERQTKSPRPEIIRGLVVRRYACSSGAESWTDTQQFFDLLGGSRFLDVYVSRPVRFGLRGRLLHTCLVATSMMTDYTGNLADRLHSGSAVIHRLTISARAERDEGTSRNFSPPSPHDPTMTAPGKRCFGAPTQSDRRCLLPFVTENRCGSFCRPT